MKYTVVAIRYFVDGERHQDVATLDDEKAARDKADELAARIALNGYVHAESETVPPVYLVRQDDDGEPETRARKRK